VLLFVSSMVQLLLTANVVQAVTLTKSNWEESVGGKNVFIKFVSRNRNKTKRNERRSLLCFVYFVGSIRFVLF
jgi:hypothetical protein